LTTKIHALVDASGLPILLKLTAGQAHDGRSAADMLDGIGSGQTLLADRAYDSNALREKMIERGAWPNIKPLSRRKDVPVFSPSPTQPRRALLQSDQTLPSRRYPLREARRKLSRPCQTRRRQNMASRL
jgi:transposase